MSKSFKRVYARADISAAGHGHAIHLDGKPVKTPGGRVLAVPTAALAEAVAAEWNAQGEVVIPATMPLTQLVSTALDRVEPDRDHIIAELMKYAGTDLLCYRAEIPTDLAERQTREWQPLLDWATLALDAPLTTTTAMLAIHQPPGALAALRRILEHADPWRLTAVQSATAVMGSLILALALAEGRLTAEQAFALSQLDETYQIEQWGQDEEAAERHAELRRDVAAAARLLELLAV
ncbi:ATP12 family chaperone protein [Magnetospirillum sp. SS-4]|uniref:ATP12 family chaperone protein n=1 Tax=Magnetospirillum sp. SS-4 TaxID=2681465 RepID=UPI001382BB3D|nr:ATP12 family protein [Magnetospirillum sp. SS-4]CAA7615539.1 F1-ATPase chaperone protein [Magnetospirillum sp. SS-4]